MSLAGKVTVKHYLEKKVKPILIYGEVWAYPLYIRITVNRRTTQLKSITGALMSENAFERYVSTGKVYNYETHLENYTNHFLHIEEEPQLVKLCIETLASKIQDYDFSNRNVRAQLMYLLTSARQTFINLGHSRDYYYDEDTLAYLLTFNRELSIINSIKFIEPVIKQDIRPFFPSDFLKQWQVIELIKCLGIKEMPFVEFYQLDYMKMFLDNLKRENARSYCLIDETYNISESDVKKTVNWIIERFFLSIPD